MTHLTHLTHLLRDRGFTLVEVLVALVVVALGLTALVLHHPLMAGGTVLVLTVACVVGVWLGFRVIRRAFRGLFKERRQSAAI